MIIKGKGSALCPFNAGKVHSITGMHIITDDELPTADIVLVNTQENVTCASSVASLALQDLANRANQLSVLPKNFDPMFQFVRTCFVPIYLNLSNFVQSSLYGLRARAVRSFIL